MRVGALEREAAKGQNGRAGGENGREGGMAISPNCQIRWTREPTKGESGVECMHGQPPEDRGAYLVQLELGVFT